MDLVEKTQVYELSSAKSAEISWFAAWLSELRYWKESRDGHTNRKYCTIQVLAVQISTGSRR